MRSGAGGLAMNPEASASRVIGAGGDRTDRPDPQLQRVRDHEGCPAPLPVLQNVMRSRSCSLRMSPIPQKNAWPWAILKT